MPRTSSAVIDGGDGDGLGAADRSFAPSGDREEVFSELFEVGSDVHVGSSSSKCGILTVDLRRCRLTERGFRSRAMWGVM